MTGVWGKVLRSLTAPSPQADRPGAPLIRYYDEVKDLPHVFLYAVCGRSSSTALQRLLNSSGEICIFGEPWGATHALLNCLATLERLNTEHRRKSMARDYEKLVRSFAADAHDQFYPTAFRPIDETALLIKATLADLLRPAIDVSRFGFKDIGAPKRPAVLDALRSTFPASHLLFLFREPCAQWRSVRGAGSFRYSHDLAAFLSAYHRSSEAYLASVSEPTTPPFVEAIDLQDRDKVRALARFVGLRGVDERLIGKRVSSVRNAPSVEAAEVRVIEDSPAYTNYLRMRDRAAAFFATLSG